MSPSEWSKAVIKRDGKCRDCGADSPLHAHHIKPKATHPALRFELSNGMALCPTCHWRRHEADRAPRSRGTKRGPQRKTLLRMIGHMSGTTSGSPQRAHQRIDELEREVRKLKATIVRLRLRLAGRRLTTRP